MNNSAATVVSPQQCAQIKNNKSYEFIEQIEFNDGLIYKYNSVFYIIPTSKNEYGLRCDNYSDIVSYIHNEHFPVPTIRNNIWTYDFITKLKHSRDSLLIESLTYYHLSNLPSLDELMNITTNLGQNKILRDEIYYRYFVIILGETICKAHNLRWRLLRSYGSLNPVQIPILVNTNRNVLPVSDLASEYLRGKYDLIKGIEMSTETDWRAEAHYQVSFPL